MRAAPVVGAYPKQYKGRGIKGWDHLFCNHDSQKGGKDDDRPPGKLHAGKAEWFFGSRAAVTQHAVFLIQEDYRPGKG